MDRQMCTDTSKIFTHLAFCLSTAGIKNQLSNTTVDKLLSVLVVAVLSAEYLEQAVQIHLRCICDDRPGVRMIILRLQSFLELKETLNCCVYS